MRSLVGEFIISLSYVGTHVQFRGPPTNVKTLTPATFDSIALDKTKVVFVKFFAPVCFSYVVLCIVVWSLQGVGSCL